MHLIVTPLGMYNNQITTVMKKTLIVLVTASIAAITLTASVAASDNAHGQGTVSFESRSLPSLNFTMPLRQAAQIYSLAPENIRTICDGEYKAVRGKCLSSSRFSYAGVQVRKVDDNGTVATIELSMPGYKVTIKNVLWDDLDQIFIGADGQN